MASSKTLLALVALIWLAPLLPAQDTKDLSLPTGESLLPESALPEYERNLDHAGLIRSWNKTSLERGEKIKISGFGNFVVRDKNARAGRNSQTGQEITISARRVLTFKPSQVLKNVLND